MSPVRTLRGFMEYPDALKLVFDAALSGAKNILGDLVVVIVSLISILLIAYVVGWLRDIFSQRESEEESGNNCDCKVEQKSGGSFKEGMGKGVGIVLARKLITKGK